MNNEKLTKELKRTAKEGYKQYVVINPFDVANITTTSSMTSNGLYYNGVRLIENDKQKQGEVEVLFEKL